MALRHRALARLYREVPQLAPVDERGLPVRVTDRSVDRTPERPPPGASVTVRTEPDTRAMRPAHAGPNVPQIIRLVRHPYALGVAQPTRIPGTSRELEQVSRALPPPLDLTEGREPPALPRPDRVRLVYRAHPFDKRRQAAVQVEVEGLRLGFGGLA